MVTALAVARRLGGAVLTATAALPLAGAGGVPATFRGPGFARSALPGIGRQAAQRLARSELAKPIYHPAVPLPERVLRAVVRWLERLYRSAASVPGGWWALVALAALVVIVTAGILAWIGPVTRTQRTRRALSPAGHIRTAREHRQKSGELAQAGDLAGAIRERLRAIAAELDERGLLPQRPGWTADEFAEQAGRLLPAHADGLRSAARLFDKVCYGQRPGTVHDYEGLCELDGFVRSSAASVRPAGEPRSPAGAGGRPS